MGEQQKFKALILAGNRVGIEPVAAHENIPHKCLADICGKPIIDWVVQALEASRSISSISVCVEDPSILNYTTIASAGVKSGNITLIPAGKSPVMSILAALDQSKDPFPFLITAADSAFVDEEILDQFCNEALSRKEDILVGVAREDAIRKAYPQAKRTYLKFADGGYSGCNLFALSSARANSAIEFWKEAEQFRKSPWRLAGLLGPTTLMGFLTRRWTFDQALSKVGTRVNVTARTIDIPFPRAAIDVDKVDDLLLAREIRERMLSD